MTPEKTFYWDADNKTKRAAVVGEAGDLVWNTSTKSWEPGSIGGNFKWNSSTKYWDHGPGGTHEWNGSVWVPVTEPGYGGSHYWNGSVWVPNEGAFASLLDELDSGAALYYPSDLTSLFQALTGGSTGAVDSVVGINLDKRQMGNQTAAAFIAGQSAIAVTPTAAGADGYQSVSDGKYTLRRDGSYSGIWRLTLSMNKWYRLRFHAYPDGGESNHSIDVRVIAAGPPDFSKSFSAETDVDILLFTGADTRIDFNNVAPGYSWSFSDLVVQEIPGYHALAPSDAARPIRRSPLKIDFDGVDDVLNAVIPSNLGSTCSVYHRTAAGDDVWLDGQTINAGNYALSTTDWVAAVISPTEPSAALKDLIQRWAASLT